VKKHTGKVSALCHRTNSADKSKQFFDNKTNFQQLRPIAMQIEPIAIQIRPNAIAIRPITIPLGSKSGNQDRLSDIKA
jgi:hypothetical protein